MRARLRIDTGSETIPLKVGGAGETVHGRVSPPFMPVYPDLYDGPYDVIPSFAQQVLATASKTMAADVAVEPIPVSEVSNPSGGVTMTIGV